MSIPGFGPANTPPSPTAEFEGDRGVALAQALERARMFVAARDPAALLALFGRQYLIETAMTVRDDGLTVAQHDIEMLQTLALTISPWSCIPTSPNNFKRFRQIIKNCFEHYAAGMRPPKEGDIEELVAYQVRIQTLFYRNSLSSEVGSSVVPALVSKIDERVESRLGYRISDLTLALFDLFQIVGARIDRFRDHIVPIVQGSDVESHITDLAKHSATTTRLLKRVGPWFVENGWPKNAAFQASEMGWSQVFMFSRTELVKSYGIQVASALFDLGIRPGELADTDLLQAFLGSPIRQRPFIRLSDEHLFLPNPGLVVSFTFQIIEYVFRNEPALLTAYADARSSYLPEAIAELVSDALPSATIYREVRWQDPLSGTIYENDVVAVIGHHVFVFEAKAGKIKPASRRGGLASLKKNLRELFIEPARQAERLAQLLQSGHAKPGMLIDHRGQPVQIDIKRPVIVRKFGVCLEHFAGITATRQSYTELGLLDQNDPWAPILSLGELHMIGTHLDAEPAYFHYLSRRQTIEQQFNFMGDEQDLLSVYLTNRFWLDDKALADVRVLFIGADEPVRQRKASNPNRVRFEVPGPNLPYLLARVASQIYESGHQHRFDMLEVILNQSPPELEGMQKHAIRWNRSVSTKEDIAYIHRKIGNRTFGLALCHVKYPPIFGPELGVFSREIIQSVPLGSRPTDFLLIVRSGKKAGATYDGVHFARVLGG